MTQFNEGKEYDGIRTIKIWVWTYKKWRKKCCDPCKNGKQYVGQIIYTTQGHLFTKVTPVIDFAEKPVIQCEVPVVENTCVNDWKYMTKKTNTYYIAEGVKIRSKCQWYEESEKLTKYFLNLEKKNKHKNLLYKD